MAVEAVADEATADETAAYSSSARCMFYHGVYNGAVHDHRERES